MGRGPSNHLTARFRESSSSEIVVLNYRLWQAVLRFDSVLFRGTVSRIK
ncbi:hypothetical protein HSR121_1735 [Halapricum desulfuricans]|uniref:Uncharacterized protein n=1 Tax=Halapricum desulfuricans TaxID=2841257 RepID=A0A897N0P6_9EURY|nr:hypothetical protein HSR121_1735 [Halapricum desulfuricans]